jgi:Skp family chaperone for outer membrane proteins
MFKIKSAVLVAAALVGIGSSASAQQATQAGVGAALPDGRIAVVNSQAFPAGIGELKQKYDQVDKGFQARYQQLQSLETQLKNNYNDLKKKGTRDYEDLKAEYDRTIDTATKPVRDKLYQFLNNYAAQHSIVLVINLAGAAQSGSLAYWNPGTDITDDFIAEYNKANPVPGAAPPSAPAKPPAKP